MANLDCPVCGKPVSVAPFKSWRFGKYEVKRYECRNCKSKFNVYQSPEKTFTIPKPK